ncbi:MAG: hypothetical protein P9L99_10780 [Candidatus Lernaella stagnicola]|nr:hypothetical protein [Candidatus Lernaella stagnicola]
MANISADSIPYWLMLTVPDACFLAALLMMALVSSLLARRWWKGFLLGGASGIFFVLLSLGLHVAFDGIRVTLWPGASAQALALAGAIQNSFIGFVKFGLMITVFWWILKRAGEAARPWRNAFWLGLGCLIGMELVNVTSNAIAMLLQGSLDFTLGWNRVILLLAAQLTGYVAYFGTTMAVAMLARRVVLKRQMLYAMLAFVFPVVFLTGSLFVFADELGQFLRGMLNLLVGLVALEYVVIIEYFIAPLDVPPSTPVPSYKTQEI